MSNFFVFNNNAVYKIFRYLEILDKVSVELLNISYFSVLIIAHFPNAHFYIFIKTQFKMLPEICDVDINSTFTTNFPTLRKDEQSGKEYILTVWGWPCPLAALLNKTVIKAVPSLSHPYTDLMHITLYSQIPYTDSPKMGISQNLNS